MEVDHLNILKENDKSQEKPVSEEKLKTDHK